ncbi:MAG TPA: hypothetical protein DCG47_15040 [Spirochaetaceae bacterium]|jgi:hypothetical protein|nr:hypothetical protein [Spirochaetaceae bacterium]
MNAKRYSNRPVIALALCAAAAAGLGSCAGNPALARGAEPERLLPGGALAYAKLDRYVLEAFIEALGIEGAAAAAKEMSARTDSLVLALLPAASPLPGAFPALLAVASGRYPSGAAGLKLSGDKAWVKEGSVWRQREGELRLGFAGNSTLLLGTQALDGMSAAIRNPGPHPIPEQWLVAWSADLALYLPSPLETLASGLPFDAEAIPLRGLVISARRGEELYDTQFTFAFDDPRSAAVYAPLCRLFMYALINGIWPEKARGMNASLRWLSQDGMVLASGLSLGAGDMAALTAFAGRIP